MVKLKKTIIVLLYSLLTIVVFFSLYILCALVLSRIEVAESVCDEQIIDCYILTNGVHTDLVLPLTHSLKDWTQVISSSDTKFKGNQHQWVAFGWGDKGFYLATPTWADLTLKTALKAGFGLSTTAMHTTFYEKITLSNSCVKIKLCESQYIKLVTYIERSFVLKNKKACCVATDVRYTYDDAFYEANGTYNLFKTCNTWANSGLKTCEKRRHCGHHLIQAFFIIINDKQIKDGFRYIY